METEVNNIPEPTTEESSSIKPIGKDTVHKICSGQVVLSLAVAVKELVENSIDAGATLVEIRLREQGLESVEVSDNGSGVEEHNLDGMTAKYHTSKIRQFNDLQSVETFGFRGEALSSLCALADMVIITRHKSTDIATKIELDHEGKIKKKSPCARGCGTTVTLCNLFETLPVRKRDFKRNVKKEFAKMCQILQAYCLVSKGVRIICSNQTTKGHKTVVVQTSGSHDVLSNISSIFGSRQVNDIIELKCPLKSADGTTLTDDELLEELQQDIGDSVRLNKDNINRLIGSTFKLEGYVSSCAHGSGRSSKDRQYFFVNSRPCEPKNISKIVNDCYHRYNVNQNPFVYLNIIYDRSDVDVNLTPDKRQLLLHNENILLALIKRSLLNTYGIIPSTYKMQNTTLTSILNLNSSGPQKSECLDPIDEVPTSSSQRFSDVLSQWKRTGNTEGTAPITKPEKRKCIDEIVSKTQKLQKIHKSLSDSEGENQSDDVNATSNSSLSVTKIFAEAIEYNQLLKNVSSPDVAENIVCKNLTPAKNKLSFIEYKFDTNTRGSNSVAKHSTDDDDDAAFPEISFEKIIELDEEGPSEDNDITITCSEIYISLEEIEQNLLREENLKVEKKQKAKLERLKFKSQINPNQNKTAEDELQKEITKDCFEKMEILGQFNLGFIIFKLEDDLFIVDQHATDEKYNFETLQKTTQLHYQKLVVSQPLELTAVNEMVLIDHLEVFEKNGFKFDINNNAPPCQKIRLLGKPFSKNWEFGKEDIDELIFMLQDAPDGTICRPSRIRSMFASRACRKSVMIGTALKKSTMEMLIRHMGEIEQPWNCPHGRPTMRHLINTAMLLTEEEIVEN